MGALRKEIRADVRKAARIVISRFYEHEHQKPLAKRRLNALVKRAGQKIVPEMMQELRTSKTSARPTKTRV